MPSACMLFQGLRAALACASSPVARSPLVARVTARHTPLPPRGCRAFAAGAKLDLDDLIVTPAAAKRIVAVREKQGSEALYLRVAVEGGGCSGFQYTFAMEEAAVAEDDW